MWDTFWSGFALLFAFYAAVASPDGWIKLELLCISLLASVQVFGTIIADNCSHPLNGPSTYLAFFLVIIQPWTFNEWQWAISQYRGKTISEDHKLLVRVLAWAFAIGMLLRASPCAADYRCIYCARGEPFCASTGASACTMRGASHIFWTLPLRPANFLFPGFWAHISLSYIPSLVVGDKYERIQTIILFTFGMIIPFCLASMVDRDSAFDEVISLSSLASAPLYAVAFVFASKNKILKKRNKKVSLSTSTTRPLPSKKSNDAIDPDQYDQEGDDNDDDDMIYDDEMRDEEDEEELDYDDDEDDDMNPRLSFDDISSADESEPEPFLTMQNSDGSTRVRRRKRL